MKRLFAIMMALALVLSLSVTAFAAGGTHTAGTGGKIRLPTQSGTGNLPRQRTATGACGTLQQQGVRKMTGVDLRGQLF